MSQNGAYKIAGRMTVDECMQAWINSPGHEALLRDATGDYGAVAYYTYNSATTGVTWSVAIYTCWSRDEGSPTWATQELWPIILDCKANNEVF